METSDSEYFESADEDFSSDEDITEKKKDVTTKIKEEPPGDVIKKLDDLKLPDNKLETNLINLDNNKNTSQLKVESTVEIVKKDDENNLHMESESVKITQKQETVEGAKSTIEDQKKEPEEENLWDDDVDWDQPKLPPLSEKKLEENEENIWGHSKKTEGDKEQKVDVVKKEDEEKTEENMWDDDELDWGQENDESNMWENDTWETIEQPPKQTDLPPPQPQSQQQNQPDNSSWGSSWGNWGVSTLLSTASQGVSTLTQGISTVLESGIGVPDPEELAKINKVEKEKTKDDPAPSLEEDNRQSGFGLGNLVMGVSQLTKLVETTGTKVISGGLDTLETIGKKTMEVLQEGDPGLRKKRAFLRIDQDKPVLSQVLREAKEKAEKENKELEQKHFAKKAKNYETLFDDHQGLVHLEALEMLSKQCDIKLQTLLETYSGQALTDMQETMDQVKELCELPGEDEEEDQQTFETIKENLESAVSEINIPITYKKLTETWIETEEWLKSLKLDLCDERELHQTGIETLAQLTAIAVEQFHKAGELLLVKDHRSTADEADSLVQLTTNLVALISIVANSFSDKLNAKSLNSKNKDEINELITNVFLEAANSSSYIQDAFQLLIPVLQAGAV